VDIAHSKILYIYTVSYTQFRDSELTLLSEPLAMDARVRKDGHPMPEVAAFMAKLRAAFGDKLIDDAVRRGKEGVPVFFACENGRDVGTAIAKSENTWLVDEAIRGRRYCDGCDGKCVGLGVRCSEWLKRGNKEKEQ
jgi:hypothetical protein